MTTRSQKEYWTWWHKYKPTLIGEKRSSIFSSIEIENEDKQRRLIRRSTRFQIVDGNLYKKSIHGPLLRYLNADQALYVMREIYEESCGNYSEGRLLA